MRALRKILKQKLQETQSSRFPGWPGHIEGAECRPYREPLSSPWRNLSVSVLDSDIRRSSSNAVR
jgi:hypothetical protein